MCTNAHHFIIADDRLWVDLELVMTGSVQLPQNQSLYLQFICDILHDY